MNIFNSQKYLLTSLTANFSVCLAIPRPPLRSWVCPIRVSWRPSCWVCRQSWGCPSKAWAGGGAAGRCRCCCCGPPRSLRLTGLNRPLETWHAETAITNMNNVILSVFKLYRYFFFEVVDYCYWLCFGSFTLRTSDGSFGNPLWSFHACKLFFCPNFLFDFQLLSLTRRCPLSTDSSW